ncbi:hypothetical protein BDZ89DRAFT_238804 [Hymenopellis radicata]|nr:hypothetical protein BDZ89DRAFT_238804 [Hymenopellis radicata]
MKRSFKDALMWGNGTDTESAIFFRGYYGVGDAQKRFCVKLLFNIDKVKADEDCYKAIDYMLADARFYAQHLKEVAGVLVPRHYGVWRAQTGEWGGMIMCSITEWVGVPWEEISKVKGITDTLRRLAGRTVERLHDHNIYHGRITNRYEMHHLLFRLDNSDTGPEPQCFVVDFSRATMDPCSRNLPILPVDTCICPEARACLETSCVAALLGMFQMDVDPAPETHMFRAIRFHERYSHLHPTLSNREVLMVQRRHFFNDRALERNIRDLASSLNAFRSSTLRR